MQNTFLVTLLSYLFISCGSQVKVSTDHDELAYFNLLKNYKWYESGKPSAEISSLSHRRLHSAINRELALEGYKIVEKLDQADFFVNYAVAKKR